MSLYSNSLFVGDLPKFCSEQDLEKLFSPFGPILDVKIKRNNNTGKTLSYGFVTLSSLELADEARMRMDGCMLMGRKLRYVYACLTSLSPFSPPPTFLRHLSTDALCSFLVHLFLPIAFLVLFSFLFLPFSASLGQPSPLLV